MESKTKKIIIVAISFMFVISLGATVYALVHYDKELKESLNGTTDSRRFKEEYEQYNEANLYPVTINENNIIKYVSDRKANKIIKEGTGVIFFGDPENNYARYLISALFEAAENSHVDRINYLNVKDIKTEYKFSKKGKVMTLIQGSDYYTEIIDNLKEYLPNYVIMKDDTPTEILKKDLPSATVICIKDGNVIGININTVTTNSIDNPLTESEYQLLVITYQNMFDKLNEEISS